MATAALVIDLVPSDIEVDLDVEELHDLVPTFAEHELLLTAERRLLVALLEQALADLADRDERVRNDARAWFLDDASTGSGFTFRCVCDELNLSADDVRRRLDRLAGGTSARRVAALRAWSSSGSRRRSGGPSSRKAA